MTRLGTTGLLLLLLLFAACKPNSPRVKAAHTRHRDTILLVTLQFEEKDLLAAIRQKIESFYGLPVKLADAPLPADAFLPQRQRYSGNVIINHLSELKGGYRFVAGFTSKDIATRKNEIPDWGVFGLGTLNNSGCITSSFRLHRNASKALLLQRLEKVVLHEIGHNHGLPHCALAAPCLMKDAAAKIATVDAEPMDVCAACRKKLQAAEQRQD